MAEWARVTNTTINRYIRGEEDAIKRNRKILAMLEKRGRIKYNISGDQLDWKVKYRRAVMSVNNGEQNIEFSRINRFKTANLDFEGYTVADSMTKREKLMIERLKEQSGMSITKLLITLAAIASERMGLSEPDA